MRILVATLAAAAVLVAVDASCAFYMWEDEQGVTNFAEDYGNIPEKYRKKARIVSPDPVDDDENEPAEELQGTKSQNSPVPAAKEGVTEPPPAKTEFRQKLFGGRDESYWANEFGRLKADLRSYKEQLDAINSRLANTEQMSRSEYKSLDNTKKLLEAQEGAARRKLDALTMEAKKAGVPADIR